MPHEIYCEVNAIRRIYFPKVKHSIQNGLNGARLGLLPRLGSLERRLRNWRRVANALGLVPDILSTIPVKQGVASPASWSIHNVLFTRSRVIVITVGPGSRIPAAVIKLPQTGAAAEHLRQQGTILAQLYSDERLSTFRELIPAPLAQGTIANQFYLVEGALPGRDARLILHRSSAREQMQRNTAEVINRFHHCTGRHVVVDAQMLERSVDQPLQLVQRINTTLPSASENEVVLQQLKTELYSALGGRRLYVSWIHGDLWPGNLLVAPEGTLTGLVDWDKIAPDELPMQDLLQLLIQTRRLRAHHAEIAPTIQELVGRSGWTASERALLDAAELPLPLDTAGSRAVVMLYWLQYMDVYFSRRADRLQDRAWLTNNVGAVLECLQQSS